MQDQEAEGGFSFSRLGANLVSAVTNTARNFISEVYKEEIGAVDDEMRSDDNL